MSMYEGPEYSLRDISEGNVKKGGTNPIPTQPKPKLQPVEQNVPVKQHGREVLLFTIQYDWEEDGLKLSKTSMTEYPLECERMIESYVKDAFDSDERVTSVTVWKSISEFKRDIHSKSKNKFGLGRIPS